MLILWYNDYLGDIFTTENYREFTPHDEEVLEDGYYAIRGGRNIRYCRDAANGMICNADMAGPEETYYVQKLGNNQYGIRSMKNSLWCSQTTTGLRCTASTLGDWEVFNLRRLGHRKYSIQSAKNKMYCADAGYGMVCDVSTMSSGEFQQFEFISVPWENIK
jgi:hypothetical protein